MFRSTHEFSYSVSLQIITLHASARDSRQELGRKCISTEYRGTTKVVSSYFCGSLQ